MAAEAAAAPAPPAAGPDGSPAAEPSRATRWLTGHIVAAAALCLAMALLWAVTGAGTFWPVWVWFGLAIGVGLHVLVLRAVRSERPGRGLELAAGLCAEAGAILVAIWLLSGGGDFWPAWPLFDLAVVIAILVVIDNRDDLPWARTQALSDRVDTLTRTRRGALDVQAAQLRQIERDLHDGAQARLVALTMQLGRAEARLDEDSEAAELVRQAREEAGAAIAELRDLARGIAPPVLADRGLAAAVEALGRRQLTPVEVHATEPDPRPAPVVEAAAYFVVAEALTNVAKHAGGAPATVTLARHGDTLVVEVRDHGPGGATEAGSGLTGLRHRVEALDGTLHVVSPPGGPTTLTAQLPCGS
jgi:signal transduction histidine kinase